jgi:hypothetical protein
VYQNFILSKVINKNILFEMFFEIESVQTHNRDSQVHDGPHQNADERSL